MLQNLITADPGLQSCLYSHIELPSPIALLAPTVSRLTSCRRCMAVAACASRSHHAWMPQLLKLKLCRMLAALEEVKIWHRCCIGNLSWLYENSEQRNTWTCCTCAVQIAIHCFKDAYIFVLCAADQLCSLLAASKDVSTAPTEVCSHAILSSARCACCAARSATEDLAAACPSNQLSPLCN